MESQKQHVGIQDESDSLDAAADLHEALAGQEDGKYQSPESTYDHTVISVTEGEGINESLRDSDLCSSTHTIVSEGHVSRLIDEKRSIIESSPASQRDSTLVKIDEPRIDRLFLVQKMRHLFRKSQEEGCWNTLMKLIEVPLTFIRDYTCPMAEHAAWDRNRAAVVPTTVVLAFFYLDGNLNGDDSSTYL